MRLGRLAALRMDSVVQVQAVLLALVVGVVKRVEPVFPSLLPPEILLPVEAAVERGQVYHNQTYHRLAVMVVQLPTKPVARAVLQVVGRGRTAKRPLLQRVLGLAAGAAGVSSLALVA